MIVTLVVLAFGTLLSAVATDISVLIAGRVIQGAGGAIFPLAFGIIRDEFPRERVPGGIALISTLLGIGGGLGIVLAGPIVDALSYHWLFWIPLIFVIAVTIATVFFVPESPIKSPGQDQLARRRAALVLARGRAGRDQRGLELGLDERQDARPARRRGRAARHLDLGREPQRRAARRHGDDAHPRRLDGQPRGVPDRRRDVLLLRADPRLRRDARSSAGYGFGATVTAAGLFMLPSTAMMLIAGPIGGRLTKQVGSRVPLILGCLTTTASFALLAFAHDQRWEIYVGAALLGAGIGLAFAALANLIVEVVTPEQTGVATGMNTVMRTVGGSVGSQIGASLITGTVVGAALPTEAGFTAAFAAAAGACAVAALASLAVPRPVRAQPEPVAVAA